jgi:dihydrofolate synthase/folylpolyglutamate synthase
VITGVALDHQAILGATVAEIAIEKAGIIKRGQRVVLGESRDPMVRTILDAAATAAGAIVTTIEDAAIAMMPAVALAGDHQRRNAAAAMAAIDHLEAIDVVHVPLAARVRALAEVRHPGRFEVIGDVILDGAHNPDGAAALAATLRDAVRIRRERVVVILAISADKDARAIVRALEPIAEAIVATRYQQERALDPAALAALAREVTRLPIEEAPELASALVIARRRGRTIVVCGSLFLVGEARTLLLGAPTDPIAVSDPAPPTA